MIAPMRLRLAVPLLLLAGLLAFAAIPDVALQEQAGEARDRAERAATEHARLVGLSVRAKLAQIEQHVLSGRGWPGVMTDTLASPPARTIPSSATVSYARRPRAELSRLLRSTGATPSGLPEAVVARIALGETSTVALPGDVLPPDPTEALLAGRLPVRPEDLTVLAEVLGVAADPRVGLLRRRLESAPSAADLPQAPSFRRRRGRDAVEGWSLARGARIRYSAPLRTLLEPQPAAAADFAGDGDLNGHPVPDVDGLAVRVPVRASPEAFRLQLLRAALWLALLASAASLFSIRRALAAETRAVAREKAFLASITHELRTPLAAIRLLAERLAAGRGDAREYGVLVADESRRLEGLVERVLSLTRVGERPRLTAVDVEALVRSAVVLIAPRAERRGVKLVCHVEPDLPCARWDEEAVRHALLNLLDNAVRHGRAAGNVAVCASVQDGAVCLSVRDDGPGIGPRVRRTLFQRFVRGTSEAGGTGLGLHFVDQVVRAHGGRIDLRSEPGAGCVFAMRLPPSQEVRP